MKVQFKRFIQFIRFDDICKVNAISLLVIFVLLGRVDSISQNVVSLHPLFTEKNALILSNLEGRWHNRDFDLTIAIKKTGDNFYSFTYGEGNDKAFYEAVVVKIQEQYFLDILGILPASVRDPDFRNSFIQCHTFYKLIMEEDQMLLKGLTNSWFDIAIQDENIPIEVKPFGDRVLLLSETSRLHSFFAQFGNEPGFFDGGLIFKRNVPSEIEKPKEELRNRAKSASQTTGSCLPEFPIRQGWLGADGDVSVSLGPKRSLFIFSDTWIGKENQLNRSESAMISNSVGIISCLPNGETEVNYYWSDMYSGSDEPIFKSYTDRYRYWVVDAFMRRETLFVILEKVGPKVGAAADEIFNFTLMGYTLAKVTNPYELPPDWTIELTSLTDFDSQNFSLRNHAIKGDSIYFFVGNNDKSMGIVRKQLDQFENFEVPFEFFTEQKTWKKGVVRNEIGTVIEGFRSNTVKYHPDLQQWIMIHDVKFLDNKIFMRTSKSLTGPWSAEIPIFEIPEVTPGKKGYNPLNFAYLARECIQYYDEGKKTMLITYDVNNSRFSDIVKDLSIYIPKVVSISLEDFIPESN